MIDLNDEGLIKDITKECFTVYESEDECVVCYKGVPLWRTVYEEDPKDIEGCQILLMTEEVDEEEDTYFILGVTPVLGAEDMEDYSTYGDWNTKEKALEWLENPYPLY